MPLHPSSLPKFTQYVTCHTRDNKTLDLFYANTKEAYHSLPLPPLGRADHNLVHLLPVYKTLVHRQPAVTRTVKKWSEEAEEALKDCFNTTLWDVFSDAHGEDIDSLTHCLTDYINFCVENTVPTRTVRSFSNSKPWITPDIKALLKEKRRAFCVWKQRGAEVCAEGTEEDDQEGERLLQEEDGAPAAAEQHLWCLEGT
ncbi:hypothetical protein L3Q82_007608 [Scortum barcoo]|uniref:Uncharacterized protein n=1 Tax=Scortum barcoo TaxID=214431 RepID=A0ACB8WNP4_9TELE|nr:hypothetical protein L3Q82_007608 [Scortum barcoo]